MARAVLVSIRPEWVNKIVTGEKTVEIRKNRPNLETPFKAYIYCTKGKLALLREYDDPEEPYKCDIWGHADFHEGCGRTILGCKVVGEFVCDKIYEVAPLNHAPDDFVKQACLTREEIVRYLNGKGYAWHISNLKIYDAPKKLSEFTGLRASGVWAERYKIKRAPQSWCYVEV